MNATEGRVPSRRERKRRPPARRGTVSRGVVWVPVTGGARSRPAGSATGLWIMVLAVGGAIVVLIEQMWLAVRSPLRNLGYAAYALTVIVLATGLMRGRFAAIRRKTAVKTDPRPEPESPPARVTGEIPLVLDAGTLDDLRHAIESAFPELTEGERSRPAGS